MGKLVAHGRRKTEVRELLPVVRDSLLRLAKSTSANAMLRVCGRWSRHTVALAHAFAADDGHWTPMDDIVAALMASDNRGMPVDEQVALAVVDGLCASGFIEQGVGSLRPLLPSLSAHFLAVRQSVAPNNKVVAAVRAALPAADGGNHGVAR